jgi:hypothetical protein
LSQKILFREFEVPIAAINNVAWGKFCAVIANYPLCIMMVSIKIYAALFGEKACMNNEIDLNIFIKA